MKIDQKFIDEYMNFILEYAKTQNYYNHNSFRYTISNIDVEVVSRTTIGSNVIQTNIIVFHDHYTVRYKKIWSSYVDNITTTLEGNEDIFSQHLVILKLL